MSRDAELDELARSSFPIKTVPLGCNWCCAICGWDGAAWEGSENPARDGIRRRRQEDSVDSDCVILSGRRSGLRSSRLGSTLSAAAVALCGVY